MVVGGLFLGVVVRWLVITTPPLPVVAAAAAEGSEFSATTNSLVLPKTEGASPSARD